MIKPMTTGHVLLVMVITSVLAAGGSIAFTAVWAGQFCDYLIAERAITRQTPASTPLGRARAEQLERLVGQICRE